jgi:hypothetical protein
LAGHQKNGQNLHTVHSLVEVAPDHDLKAESVDHSLWVSASLVWDVPSNNQVPSGIIQSNTAGRQLGEHVYADMSDQVCKNLVCNPDTQRGALSGVRIDTHLQRNSTHILQTTNTPAYASDYTHARIHMHLLSYRVHVASACRLLPAFLAHADE